MAPVLPAEHAAWVWSVALSQDGKRLVTVRETTAILWDVAVGKQLQIFEGHRGMIMDVALSQDGKQVVTGSHDKTAILWEAASGKKLGTFQVQQPGEDSWVTCLALSVEGDQILTGSFDGTTLWETATGKKLHTFQGHTKMLTSVALSADGRHAWSSSYDGTTRLWDTKSGKELCSLLIFEGGKDWLIVTPEGFFDGSGGAWKRMSFRETGTPRVLEDDATKRKFHRPGLLGTLCRGEQPKP
jgi:WD40 repeat protein